LFSPDGSTLASASWDRTIKLWDATAWRGLARKTAKAGGLVGHWKLDEEDGSAAIDSSGKGNSGTYVNAPERSADVPSLKFANPGCRTFVQGKSQYVEVPDSPSLRLTGSLTLAAWVRPTRDTTEFSQGIIDDKFVWTGTEASGGYFLRLSTNRTLLFSVIPHKGGPKGTFSPEPIPTGSWTHVAGGL
jgi:WD40 repeat protein